MSGGRVVREFTEACNLAAGVELCAHSEPPMSPASAEHSLGWAKMEVTHLETVQLLKALKGKHSHIHAQMKASGCCSHE